MMSKIAEMHTKTTVVIRYGSITISLKPDENRGCDSGNVYPIKIAATASTLIPMSQKSNLHT